MIVYPPPGCGTRASVLGTRGCANQPKKRLVQWKETNVEEGIVMVDQAMLSKLIKNEPIQKYYKLDPQPFATGMFASVRRCKSIETGQVFAAKFSSRVRYGEDSTREIHHEIALLSLTSPSPRIVKLHDVFQTQQEIIIVMEFAPGGDLQTIIDDNLVPFESDVVKYIQQVVEGLAYLHQRKIAHLDIKPQNLVMMGEFPDCDIKVCDFEISRVILEGTEIHEILGTPEYVAPEILHYEPITLAADMWSLGVTTYVLLTGFSPFGGETDQETFLNISRAQVDFPDELFEDISQEAKDFVRKLLRRKPSERMTAKECLKHPWLTKHRRGTKLVAESNVIGETRRVGCSSCPPSQTSLRKYLSKSREALFEKVISQQKQLEKQQPKDSLRKSTLLQQVKKTRRLCESQMSLVSKSREKVIAEQHALLNRSREKLYGLRSLSKSHEVLNLYKSLVNLNQDEDNPLPGILKSLSKKVEIGDGNGVSTSNNFSENSIIASNICSEKAIIGSNDGIKNGGKGSDENKENNNTRNLDKEKEWDKEIQIGDKIRSEPRSPVVSNSDTLSLTEFNSTTDSEISEEDSCSSAERTTEEDEPRFTVKQLISAYNKHQEVVTKTSLEVTMSSEQKEKMISESEGTYKFPTGPNALRLFIPDIKITSRKKRMPRKKTGIGALPVGDASDLGTTDLSAINARLNEFPSDDFIETDISSRLKPQTIPKVTVSRSSSSSSCRSELEPLKPLTPQPSSKDDTTTSSSKVISRPDRKSFSLTRPSPPTTSNDKTRRKSSPPTMKPFL